MNTTDQRTSIYRGSQRSEFRLTRHDFLEKTNRDRHPAALLLEAHRDELYKNRAKLLREVRRVSQPLAQAVAKMLQSRDALDPPAIGEAWPWLVGDLAHLSPKKIRDVAKAWLAVYIYTLLLDKTCDTPKALQEPKDTLAGALLFEVGLGDFYSMTAGTTWQKVVRDSVRLAIRNQEIDVRLARKFTHSSTKRQSAVGKNAGFLMCTAALAAVTGLDGTTLNRFARRVLIAFQHLDDIADFEDDWKVKNFTPLLVGAYRQLKMIENHELRRLEILDALIKSGSLRRVLIEARGAITLGLDDVGVTCRRKRQSSALKFFHSLQNAMTAAIESIDYNFPLLKTPGLSICKKAALQEVEYHLYVVAQQS